MIGLHKDWTLSPELGIKKYGNFDEIISLKICNLVGYNRNFSVDNQYFDLKLKDKNKNGFYFHLTGEEKRGRVSFIRDRLCLVSIFDKRLESVINRWIINFNAIDKNISLHLSDSITSQFFF